MISSAVLIIALAGVSLSLSKEKSSGFSLMLNQTEAVTQGESGYNDFYAPVDSSKICPVYGLVWEDCKWVSKVIGYEYKTVRSCLKGNMSCIPSQPCQ